MYRTEKTRILREYLTETHTWRQRKDKLHPDGSFYDSDAYLAYHLDMSIDTIRRARRRLAEQKIIRFIIGDGRSIKTKYWILSRGAITA